MPAEQERFPEITLRQCLRCGHDQVSSSYARCPTCDEELSNRVYVPESRVQELERERDEAVAKADKAERERRSAVHFQADRIADLQAAESHLARLEEEAGELHELFNDAPVLTVGWSLYARVKTVLERLENAESALRTIRGPEDRGPWMLVYREAGGGYEGLQAIAEAALSTPPTNPSENPSPSGTGDVAE